MERGGRRNHNSVRRRGSHINKSALFGYLTLIFGCGTIGLISGFFATSPNTSNTPDTISLIDDSISAYSSFLSQFQNYDFQVTFNGMTEVLTPKLQSSTSILKSDADQLSRVFDSVIFELEISSSDAWPLQTIDLAPSFQWTLNTTVSTSTGNSTSSNVPFSRYYSGPSTNNYCIENNGTYFDGFCFAQFHLESICLAVSPPTSSALPWKVTGGCYYESKLDYFEIPAENPLTYVSGPFPDGGNVKFQIRLEEDPILLISRLSDGTYEIPAATPPDNPIKRQLLFPVIIFGALVLVSISCWIRVLYVRCKPQDKTSSSNSQTPPTGFTPTSGNPQLSNLPSPTVPPSAYYPTNIHSSMGRGNILASSGYNSTGSNGPVPPIQGFPLSGSLSPATIGLSSDVSNVPNFPYLYSNAMPPRHNEISDPGPSMIPSAPPLISSQQSESELPPQYETMERRR